MFVFAKDLLAFTSVALFSGSLLVWGQALAQGM